jgi:hypothetical protein
MAIGDLNAAQHALAQYMSELSEEAYCAGWTNGLEDALWEVVLGERREYGQSTFTDEHAVELRRLSEACGGWIVFDGSREETWVSLSAWQTRFQGRKRTEVAANIRLRTSPSQVSNAPYSRAELLAAEDGRWPERGDRCERCGVLIPRFCDLSPGERADILNLKSEGGVVDAMDELRKRTGAPVRFAKIWVIHHGEAQPRYSGPPCPHCGKPLASDRAKQCLHCHTDWH